MSSHSVLYPINCCRRLMCADCEILNVILLLIHCLFVCLFINRKKAEEEDRVRKEAEAEAAAQIAELDRQLKVRQRSAFRNTSLCALKVPVAPNFYSETILIYC